MATPETKPPIDANTWAEAGSRSADGGNIGEGWAGVLFPSFQRFNWILNKIHRGLRYLTHRGVPDYDATESYAVDDRVQWTDHKSYRCKQANTPSAAKAPSDGDYWEPWGHTDAAVTSLTLSAIGTLSGDVSSGIAASNGATITNAQHFNMPGTTVKMLSFSVLVPVIGGTAITLSGDAAFANGALNAVCSYSGAVTPDTKGASVHVSDATTIVVAAAAAAPATELNVCVLVTGH